MDGHYARKYGFVSKFGDYYDHVKDVVVVIGILIVLAMRYKVGKKAWTVFILVMGIFTVLMSIHYGCQEKLYKKDESKIISITKILCPGDPSKNIKYTRWVGCGTFTIVLFIMVWYMFRKNRKIFRL